MIWRRRVGLFLLGGLLLGLASPVQARIVMGGGVTPASGGGGGGDVFVSGTPAAGQVAVWTDATHIEGVSTLNINYAAAAVSTAGMVTTSTEYVTTGGGGVARTLPAAASGTSTRRFRVLKVDAGAGALTIPPAGADTINGSTTPLSTTTQWAGFDIQESATNGWVAQPISSTAAAGASFPLVGTSNANPCFAVGPNGATNPTLSVNCSVASAGTGIEVIPAISGSGVTLAALGGVNETLTLRPKGTGDVNIGNNNQHISLLAASGGNVWLRHGGGIRLSTTNVTLAVTPAARTSGALTAVTFTGAADTALTAGTEVKDFVVDLAQTKQHAGNSNITLQRHIHFLAGTDTCATATCTISDDHLLALSGPPSGGTNSLLLNAAALYIESRALTNVTNASGLIVNAPTGAATNLAAQFVGPVRLPVIKANTGALYLCINTDGTIISQVAACSGT